MDKDDKEIREKRLLLSEKMLLTLLTVGIMGISVIFVFSDDKTMNVQIQTMASWVQNFLVLVVAIIGGTYIKNEYAKTIKGGTPYYKYQYRTLDNEQIFQEYCDQFSELDKLKSYQWLEKEEGNTNYWNIVFYLQEMDNNFVKAWNDFNYYNSKKMRKESDFRYFLLVQNYVYIKVYNTYKAKCR